jgi:hypoxanthine phosphoribosyltransferase
MSWLLKYNEFLTEGVRLENGKYVFDFKEDKEGDIMSLKFADTRSRKMKHEDTTYEYYSAYDISTKSDYKEFIHKLKLLDNTAIDSASIQLLVNKAVIGIDEKYKLSSFDAIIYPKSSSKILTVFAEQLAKKSGVAQLVPDAFVKASNDEIKFDWEKIEGITNEATKKSVMKVVDSIKNNKGEFKMKEVYPPYRKFVSEFLIFNNEDSRRIFNLVKGRVLLVDDYRTSGTSLKQMMDLLFKYSPDFLLSTILIKIS